MAHHLGPFRSPRLQKVGSTGLKSIRIRGSGRMVRIVLSEAGLPNFQGDIMMLRHKGRMIASMAFVSVIAAAQSQPSTQAKAQAKEATAKGLTAGEFFKNVTTSTLKGLTPSDFLGAMGVMTAAVGYDCSNCHPGAGTDAMDWVTDSVPQKKTARKMVEMVAAINKQNFAGAQQVTCWTCHHGLDLPTTSVSLDKLYGE